MSHEPGHTSMPRPPRSVLHAAMLLLLAEKVIQHVFVTVAFVLDLADIRDTVAVPWIALTITGAGLAGLFALAFHRLRRGARRVHALMTALALADVVGEFIAQGTLAITVNVSFLVALALLVLVAVDRRRARHAA